MLTRVDTHVKCTVELGDGGRSHTIDANVSKLEKVSELPFYLQDACRYSGIGEVAALSLVDLWLKERALIHLVPAGGAASRLVGKGSTPQDVRRAKAFKIVILPPTTR